MSNLGAEVKKLSTLPPLCPARDFGPLLAAVSHLNSTLDTRLKFLALELSAARSDLIHTLNNHLGSLPRYESSPDLTELSGLLTECVRHHELAGVRLPLAISKLQVATDYLQSCSQPCECPDPSLLGVDPLAPPVDDDHVSARSAGSSPASNGSSWDPEANNSLCYVGSYGGYNLTVCLDTAGGLPHHLEMLFYYGELLWFHNYLFFPDGPEKMIR